MNERLAIGTLTKTALLANSAYLLSNFPDATHQATWTVAYGQIATPYAERVSTPAGVKSQGLLNFKWRFTLVNFDMFEHLFVTLMESQFTRAVTVLTKNNFYPGADKWVAINCMMNIWELTEAGVNPTNNTYFREVELSFYQGVYAADA